MCPSKEPYGLGPVGMSEGTIFVLFLETFWIIRLGNSGKECWPHILPTPFPMRARCLCEA